ncbi:hypothetical protein ACH492_22085 [Streptomyces sp. NPDC019443]|uniref:hypothetical protein n=1 Tax=Streptomyces sp. NPDC019443 TaxID=3365061 RepID=UPI003799F0F1
MNPETLASIVVSTLTVGAGVYATRSARRTPRQDKRDDLALATDLLEKDVARLEKRVEKGEVEVEKFRERISDLEEANNWLRGRLRDLVGAFRIRGDEPPAQRPMSERAARVLNGIEL